MSKSFHFYALNGSEAAAHLRAEADGLVDQVRRQVEGAGYEAADGIEDPDEGEATIEGVATAARRICTGALPPECSYVFFDTLGRLAGLVGEDLPLSDFQDTRWSFMEAVGILPLFGRAAPFSLPAAEPGADCGAGYLPNPEARRLVASGLSELSPTDDPGVQAGRDQFLEVLESVAEDGLHALVVY